MSDGVLVGKIISLSLDTMTCTVNTVDRDTLCEMPFGGEVVVVRMNDWLQNTLALRSATSHIVTLEVSLQSARDDIERIGAARDQLRAEVNDMVSICNAQAFEIGNLRAGIKRIGGERDQMVAANVELQERLSACIASLEDNGK